MASVDFRRCLYALSDVIINRPRPLRIFDQIHMKLPDMLLQAELMSRWFDKKRIVFIGDGDAVALSVAHLGVQLLLPGLPEHITVLDFDERVVNSILLFAEHHGLKNRIVLNCIMSAMHCQRGTGTSLMPSTPTRHGEQATTRAIAKTGLTRLRRMGSCFRYPVPIHGG
jgi:hypothetical protein